MDIKRTLLALALGIATTGAVMKFNRNGCGDGTYTTFENGCEMKMYPAVFVEGNRCEAGTYQNCGKVQGTYINLYEGYSDTEMGSRIISDSPDIYWIRQRENSDHCWRMDSTGKVLGTGLTGQSKGEDITGRETAADIADRTRMYGLVKKCEGMLEMKFNHSF